MSFRRYLGLSKLVEKSSKSMFARNSVIGVAATAPMTKRRNIVEPAFRKNIRMKSLNVVGNLNNLMFYLMIFLSPEEPIGFDEAL